MIWQIASIALGLGGVAVTAGSAMLGDDHGVTHGMLMMIMALQVGEAHE